MACHSVTEAAKMAGVTRRTIYRYLKAGKLSASVTSGESAVIETSELLRVFGALSQPEPKEVSRGSQENQPAFVTVLLAELSHLREEIAALTSKVSHLESKLALPAPAQEEGVAEWVARRRLKRGG